MANAGIVQLAPPSGTRRLPSTQYAWEDADSRAHGMAPDRTCGYLPAEQRRFFEDQWKEWCEFAPVSKIFLEPVEFFFLPEEVIAHEFEDHAVPGECFSEDVFAELSLELSDLM